ncbi:SCNM1 protein, partial [Tachuris rubrigastra]|nr:SCNM1 protein [Tachuris rubrigastra]
MSFKRDGDDPGPLGALQKRRVSDLLANSIPEDEALLLRSGRFACSVSPHRPVCDTLEALAVHRAGRRHLQKAPGVQVGVASPAPPVGPPHPPVGPPGSHPFPSQESQAPLLARTRWITRSALLKSTPYSSCCRRKGAQGSSSRVGTTRMVPEPPLRNAGESRESAALLLEHGSGTAGGSQGVPRGQDPAHPGPNEPKPSPTQAPSAPPSIPSSGWLQDPSGKWVKDGNAEFDSDEEEPPALPPT